MFLHSLLRTNPQFVSSAIELHQSGKIPANSYVLDIDTISENAKHIVAEARKHRLTVFPMTKQFGRNAHALKALVAAGVDSFVSVDMTCARGIRQGGFQVGHLGHLVQIPKHEIAEAVSFAPRYWTVFSRFQAELISKLYPEARARRFCSEFMGGTMLSFPRMPVDLRSKQLTLTSTILPGCPESTSPA